MGISFVIQLHIIVEFSMTIVMIQECLSTFEVEAASITHIYRLELYRENKPVTAHKSYMKRTY